MDYIHIDRIIFRGMHGVNPQEKLTPQNFEVSVRLGFDTKAAASGDDVAATLDYRVVKKIIQETIEGEHRDLVETLAEDIASQVLKDARIHNAEVTVKKTEVWDNGVPGVTIFRNN
jgi:dihydroneopterin aldolase